MNNRNKENLKQNVQPHRKNVWLEVLGSMNLAISILVVVAIAAIIGTVLQQNQPYTNYIIKFGPFWHEIYQALGLYDVYSAVWFLGLMGFLVLSTSVCVYRNTPIMLREMRQYRLHAKAKSLKCMKHSAAWPLASGQQSTAHLMQKAKLFLAQYGFNVRDEEFATHHTLVAQKGAGNRLGYIFTHVGMIVLLIGGLIDGNISLKIKEWLGDLKVETRDLMAKDVPAISRLKPAESISFRGAITLPEGSTSNFVFLNIRDGYLVQELPFAVELKDFRVEHYESGQPKSFESDLIIHDKEGETFEQTIAVNHPLIYRGYAIYQASFGDGGTQLNLSARSFDNGVDDAIITFTGEVKKTSKLAGKNQQYRLEIDDFKKFNVNPNTDKNIDKKFINYGSSIIFKVREEDGQAREYMNYMSPVQLNGRYYYISGMRPSLDQDYTFFHIPVDASGTADRFFEFYKLLHDDKRLRQMAVVTVSDSVTEADKHNVDLQQKVASAMIQLIELYREGGFAAVEKDIRDKVPAEKFAAVMNASLSVLKEGLQNLYLLLLSEEGIDIKVGITERDEHFFEDAISAIANFSGYGSPFYLQLNDFEQRDASGLQIARAPGKNIVYFGCILLIIGIFMMFYIAQQRFWIMVVRDPETDVLEIIFAGSTNRNEFGFAKKFNDFEPKLKALLLSSQ